MEFGELLGNEQLKIRLGAMLRQDKFPHCVLISGPRGSGKHTLARLLAAALVCESERGQFCRACPQCRKALAGQHPDIIIVDDPDHKSLPISYVREICADVYIRPNESRRKVYIFPDADKLAPRAQAPVCQNALLKTLEEPPEHAVFLILASNPGQLLPTLRSRCAELNLQPLAEGTLLSALRERRPDEREEDYRRAAACGYLGAALEQLAPPAPEETAFLHAFATRDAYEMLELLTAVEKRGRDGLLTLLQQWQALLTDALEARYGGKQVAEGVQTVRERRTAKEIMQAIEHLRTAERYCSANVNAGAVCAALAVNLSQS